MNNHLYQSPRFIRLAKTLLIFAFGWMIFNFYLQIKNIHLPFITLFSSYYSMVFNASVIILALWAMYRKRLSATQPLIVPCVLGALIVLQIIFYYEAWLLFLMRIAMPALLYWLILSMTERTNRFDYELRALRVWGIITLIMACMGFWLSYLTQMESYIIAIYLIIFSGFLIITPKYRSLHAVAWTIVILLSSQIFVLSSARFGVEPLLITLLQYSLTAFLMLASLTLLFKVTR